jgi:DNA-binding beta-propeller fold protein YncE
MNIHYLHIRISLMQVVFRPLLCLFPMLFTAGSMRGQIIYSTPYTFTTLAGYSGFGFVDGVSNAARFDGPQGAAVDNAGNVYVADTGNDTIRKITPAGVVTTLAGTPMLPGRTTASAAQRAFMALSLWRLIPMVMCMWPTLSIARSAK